MCLSRLSKEGSLCIRMIKELDSTVRDTSNHYLTLFVFHFTIIVQLYFDAAHLRSFTLSLIHISEPTRPY